MTETEEALPPTRRAVPKWMGIVPYFMSAVLFLSGIFAVFAPMPLLFIALRGRTPALGRSASWLAAGTNGAIVGALYGLSALAFYVVFVLALALAMPEFMRARRSLHATTALTLGAMAAVGVAVVAVWTRSQGLGLWEGINTQIHQTMDYFVAELTPDARRNLLGGLEIEEWKEGFIGQLPSTIAMAALAMVWLNAVLVLRLVPGIRDRMGLAPGFTRTWKAPEFLLWPAIACGFLVVMDWGTASLVGLNGLRFLLAVYAIQGLSILSFFFDAWKVRGLVRTLGFLMAIFILTPLLLALGFFDLWFDFRARVRQS